MNKYIKNTFKISATLVIAMVTMLISLVLYLNTTYKSAPEKIVEFYNDKSRPSFNWRDWAETIEGSQYKIVLNKKDPFNPIFSLIQIWPHNKPIIRADGTKSYPLSPKFTTEEIKQIDLNEKRNISIDVIHFSRDKLLRLVPEDIVLVSYKDISFNDAIKLAENEDVSKLPESDTLNIFKNPTKEEWLAKIEEKKLKLINSISNPSKTDSVDFSVSGDHEKNEILIKSLGKDMRNFGITFNDYQRMLDKEDYTYWVNDDEFILLINNFNGKDKIFPTFDLIKDYKDGIYTFNTKTKEFKMFIPITEPDRSFRVDYELTKEQIIIFTSKKTYTYDKQGKLIEEMSNK